MRLNTITKPLGAEITCACGCKRKLIRKTISDKYFSEGCRVEADRKRSREKATAKRKVAMSAKKKPVPTAPMEPVFTEGQKDILIAVLAATLDQHHGGSILLDEDAVRLAYDSKGVTFTRALGKVRVAVVVPQ